MEMRMKKDFILLVMLLAVGLSGCLPQAATTPTVTPTIQPQIFPTADISFPNNASLLPDSGCTVRIQKPTPGPTPEPPYPAITAADHVKGPADARITIVEYSDFQ
jgi:hypothetical protein